MYLFIILLSHGLTSKASITIAGSANKCSDPSQPRRVMILVPGTLNSIVPGAPDDLINLDGEKNPYFSAAVRSVMEESFCAVHVTPDLQYFGDFRENGRTTFEDAILWYNQITRDLKDRPEVWFFGHSAGGFYALYAAHLNEQNKKFALPIKKIITMSTPFDGVEFIDRITSENSIIASIAEKFLNAAWPMDLRGLWELKKQNVRIFLYNLKIAANIEVHSFGGSQTVSPDQNDIMDAIFLSPPLTVLQKMINTISDGIVSLQSVFRETVLNKQSHDSNLLVKIINHPEYNIPLDHVEQVWDYRYLIALGTVHANYVLDNQLKVYNDIMTLVGATPTSAPTSTPVQ